jgi:hypothetical protein
MDPRYLLDTNICIYNQREFHSVRGLKIQNWAS